MALAPAFLDPPPRKKGDPEPALVLPLAGEAPRRFSRQRHFFITFLTGSLAFHICFILAVVFFDPAPKPQEASGEIPIELMSEEQAQGKDALGKAEAKAEASGPNAMQNSSGKAGEPPLKPSEPAAEKPEAQLDKPPHPPEPNPPENKPPESKDPEVKPSEVKPPEAQPPEAKPEVKPPEAKPPEVQAPENKPPEDNSAEQKPAETKQPDKPVPNTQAPQPAAQIPARKAPAASAKEPAQKKAAPKQPAPEPQKTAGQKQQAALTPRLQPQPRAEQTPETPRPQEPMQSRMSAQAQEELRRALSGEAAAPKEMPRQASVPAFVDQPEDGLTLGIPAPLPTNDPGAEPVSYKMTVFSQLARVKEYPETARARHAAGHVVLSFAIDDAGLPRSVAILHSSGEADLDTEALAMVVRAAPFPVPPAGAQREFAIDVGFSLEDQPSSE